MLITSLLAGLATIVLLFMLQGNTYHDTANPKDVIKQTQQEISQPYTIIVFHKTGCSDCKQVVRTVNRAMNQKISGIKYVVTDTKESDLYKDYNVTEVPTFVVLRKGQEIERYSGTNTTKITDILTLKKIMKGK